MRGAQRSARAADVQDEPVPAWAALLLARQAALEVKLDELTARLDRRRGAGEMDVAVGRAIATLGLTKSGSRSARELFAAASTDTTLRQALKAAFISDAEQLGVCLGRLYRRGLVERDPRKGKWGWRWSV